MEDVCALYAFQDRSIAISFFIDKTKNGEKNISLFFRMLIHLFFTTTRFRFVSFPIRFFHSVSLVRAVAHVEFASVSCSIAIRYNTKC